MSNKHKPVGETEEVEIKRSTIDMIARRSGVEKEQLQEIYLVRTVQGKKPVVRYTVVAD